MRTQFWWGKLFESIQLEDRKKRDKTMASRLEGERKIVIIEIGRNW